MNLAYSTLPERDTPPDSRPLDAMRRELREYIGRTAREAPLSRKRIAVACTTRTGEGFILHHWSLAHLSGYLSPPVLIRHVSLSVFSYPKQAFIFYTLSNSPSLFVRNSIILSGSQQIQSNFPASHHTSLNPDGLIFHTPHPPHPPHPPTQQTLT